jgi:hypothetical protein
MIKDYFVIKANVTKLGPTLISLNYKVENNVFFIFLDSRTTHSFMRMSVIERLRWATTNVVKPIKMQLAQSEMKPTHKVMFISTKNVMGPSSRQTSKCAS